MSICRENAETGATGLEPATSGVTGRRSNQLNYAPRAGALYFSSSLPGVTERDYSATPLPKKLGIREGSRLLLAGCPDGFLEALGPLPAGVDVVSEREGPLDVAVFFATGRAELERGFAELAGLLAPAGGLWVAYPKKASGVPTDLTFQGVQEIGLAAGLVDNKSCAIDDVWSGVRFVIRLRDRR